ncbi:flagellar motor protein MotB [Denitrobaculum tricleocarpae]|uniref:Flagellar motor protein MotB n=1 Tax=Denitrobaculum tricleocarpae TaxID=2591009 RepID=A0A545TTW4_9PROT|nr:flagellar motor protein MotB [Denitrobaculum tricleocarpae]TQV80591.1 flagellar motor protein MotB [Denitrobaculum tricleocarpae]
MAEEGENGGDGGGNIIIIKKVKKGGHGSHGGAWKIAYADFVTAMMAFFLLMWLLANTTEEQKKGIADYFTPTTRVSSTTSGSDGVLGGQTVTEEGAMISDRSAIGIQVTLPPAEESEPDPDAPPEETAAAKAAREAEEAARKAKFEEETKQFDEAKAALKRAIIEAPELSELVNNLVVDNTPEGLRIQLVDQDGKSMFPSGRADMFEHTAKLMALVVKAIGDLPQNISIKGHTDATPFSGANGYSNWELSTDRANASRRALIDSGLTPERVVSVVGRAAMDPLIIEDPRSPQNRRISIILLRENQDVEAEGEAVN